MDDMYKKLIEAVDALPEESTERTKKEITRKGYDTTGYGYQFLVNVMNETLGINGWGFSFEQVHESNGVYSNGKPWYEITVIVTAWVGDKETTRSCAGGHKSELHFDAYKGAITNALKKTLGLFGIGKRAYEGTIDEDYRPIPVDEKTSPPKPINPYVHLAKKTGLGEADVKNMLSETEWDTAKKVISAGSAKIIKYLKGAKENELELNSD